jgi:hypothetical protein
MSYCRFENTLEDLEDCAENMENPQALNDTEKKARLQLIRVCRNLADDFEDEIE